jgi:hypothetical protein
VAGVRTGANNQVNDFNNHASYNCPDPIGELNHFQVTGSAAKAVLDT